MASKPKAEWIGVIRVGSIELDCRLFSLQQKPAKLALQYVHLECKTVIPDGKKTASPRARDEEEDGAETVSAPSVSVVSGEFHCPKCARSLKTDEIGRGIETDRGLVLLSDAELASLQFVTAKSVTAHYINAEDPLIEVLGVRRRLLVCPKSTVDAQAYGNLFHVLRRHNRAGFIPEMVIKENASVGVIRPLVIPAAIFGQDREVLVLDLLNDADNLRDPAGIPSYPREMPPIEAGRKTKLLAEADTAAVPLNPEQCVGPRRLRLKNLMLEVLQRSFKK